MNFKDETWVIKTINHNKFDIHILADANGVYGYIVKKNPYGTVAYESNFNNEQSALNAAKLAIKSRGNMYDCGVKDSAARTGKTPSIIKDDRQGKLVKTVKNGKFDILVTVDQNGKYGYILRRGYSNVGHGANFANEEGAVYAAKSSIKSFGNLYDSACSYMDSVIGNIARKIEDEFNENDHPRDKGGKFTSKGGEGKGGSRRQEHGFYGGEKVKQEDPKRGDELNKYAVKLEKAGVDPKEIHRLNREGDLEGMKKLLPETETEKAAKEELKGSTKSDEETLEGLDDYGQNLLDYCTDIDTTNDALRALNWDTSDYEDLEQARTALKEAISQNPKAAKELWESTSNKEEIEEVRAGRETDEIVEEFKGSGIDMYAALADLGIDVQNTPEEYQLDAFKEALFNSPKFRKKAASYIKQYRGTEDEEEWFK